MLKYLHNKHEEAHGDLNPGNMMYFWKDMSRQMWSWDRAVQKDFLETVKRYPQAIQIHALHDFLAQWFAMEDEQIAALLMLT